MKRKIAFISMSVLLVGLAGCANDGGADKAAPKGDKLSCEAKPGNAVKDVVIKFSDGERKIEADKIKDLPSVDKVEAKVLDKGKGNPVVSAQDVKYNMQLTVFNGKTGEQIASEPLELPLLKDGATSGWLNKFVGCATDKGSVVAAVPAGKIWEDPAASGLPNVGAEDTLIVVSDMKGASQQLQEEDLLKQAEGVKKELPKDFPKVEIDEATGQPTVSNPENLPNPTELKIVNMVEGKGKEVKAGDEVYVHYSGVIMRDGTVFDSSWQRGKSASFKTDQVIPGFSKALIGQKVGSRVVALVPPKDGYGAEWLASQGYKEDDVMVFVVDILGVNSAE